MKQVPEIGKTYNVLSDGVINESKRYKVIVKDVILPSDVDDKILALWNHQKSECDWLYSPDTDFFIESRDEFNNMEIFVRTTYGGWFSIGDYLNCGRLDVDGELTNILNHYFK